MRHGEIIQDYNCVIILKHGNSKSRIKFFNPFSYLLLITFVYAKCLLINLISVCLKKQSVKNSDFFLALLLGSVVKLSGDYTSWVLCFKSVFIFIDVGTGHALMQKLLIPVLLMVSGWVFFSLHYWRIAYNLTNFVT
jgi:hypothetical protein